MFCWSNCLEGDKLMDINVNNLCLDVGLKYNDSVILGKDKVVDFIRNNQDEFNNLCLNKIDDSKMLYGFNSNKNPIKIGFKNELIQRIIVLTKPIEYTRYKAVISYDGHQYNGFQIQKKQKTIQGELTKVVTNINGYETLVQGCSRTDTGVHANNFVIHFDSKREITANKWLELLNYQLPRDILIKKIVKTHPIFHSRYDVYKKRYIYKIKMNSENPFKINYEWNCKNIDINILRKNLEQLVGTHDFSSFCKGDPKNTIRTIYKVNLINVDDNLDLVFEGDGFLRYMIRIIVYTLYLQSTNKLELSIKEIIEEKNRKHTKNLAPSSGLYLDQIYY